MSTNYVDTGIWVFGRVNIIPDRSIVYWTYIIEPNRISLMKQVSCLGKCRLEYLRLKVLIVSFPYQVLWQVLSYEALTNV